ncbi:MAG: hypothetical protein E7511_03040 [Ruminococcus sp.]|nr:hypothetical protein [Ruminococcus sp.]
MSQAKNWEINGVSLTLDLEDADVLERYEDAFASMEREEMHLPKDGKASARIRAYCEMYRHLYDHIFGDGTAEKIFAEKPVNAAVYDEVYGCFLEFVRTQLTESAKRRGEALGKYRPNRAQKRATLKKIGKL